MDKTCKTCAYYREIKDFKPIYNFFGFGTKIISHRQTIELFVKDLVPMGYLLHTQEMDLEIV